jgi:hypothetical protein
VGYGVREDVAVEGRRAGLPEAAVIEDEERDGLRELTPILAEEIFELLVLDRLQFSGNLEGIEKQSDIDRRVGRKGDAVGVKRDDLRGLAVVEEGKVGGGESRHGAPGGVGNDDVNVQEAFGGAERDCRGLRAGGCLVRLGHGSGIGTGGLRASAREKDEGDEKEPAGNRHRFLCGVSVIRIHGRGATAPALSRRRPGGATFQTAKSRIWNARGGGGALR